MSTNTQTQSNPLWDAILKYCGANAINVADSYYTKVTKDVGNSLDKLRQNTIAAIAAGVKASFAIASAILMASLVEAGSQLAGAAASGNALGEINPAQKDLDNAQSDLKTLQDKEKKLDPEKNKNELDKLKAKIADKTKLVKQKETTFKSVSEKAQIKSQMYNMAAQGAATIPQALSNAEQTKAKAVSDVLDKLATMLGSTYQKSNETLKSFFDTDYLGGLIALGQIQLR